MHNSYLDILYLCGTLLITSFSVIIVIFFLIQKRKQIQSRMRQQQLTFEYEHSLLSTRIEVQEQAFETVSRELHDSIAQNLSLGCLQLANLKDHTADPDIAAGLQSTLQLFRQSVKDLRLLSHSLNTGLVEQRSLEVSVKTELQRIETFSEIRCFLEGDWEDTLSPETRLVVFRIIQEALQNVIKHAHATEICLSKEDMYDQTIIRVRDNGDGFSTGKISDHATMGLLSMQQRAGQISATVAIDSLMGGGTTVTLALPTTIRND